MRSGVWSVVIMDQRQKGGRRQRQEGGGEREEEAGCRMQKAASASRSDDHVSSV